MKANTGWMTTCGDDGGKGSKGSKGAKQSGFCHRMLTEKSVIFIVELFHLDIHERLLTFRLTKKKKKVQMSTIFVFLF